MKTIKIDKTLIAETGIGSVLMNADAWPEELRDTVVELRDSWKRATSGLAIMKCKSCRPHQRAFNGMKPTELVKKRENIAYFQATQMEMLPSNTITRNWLWIWHSKVSAKVRS